MSGTPTSRCHVRQRRTRDRLPGREPRGDGGLVVVAGVTTGQGGRESRPQGEGGQVTGHRQIGRYAQCRAPQRCWVSCVSAAARPARERALPAIVQPEVGPGAGGPVRVLGPAGPPLCGAGGPGGAGRGAAGHGGVHGQAAGGAGRGGCARMPAQPGGRSRRWWPRRWRNSSPGARGTIPAGERPEGRGGVRLRPARGHGFVSGLRHIGAAAAGPHRAARPGRTRG